MRTAAKIYLRSLNLSRPLIGLHVRLEKLGGVANARSSPDEFVSKCLSQLATHLKAITTIAPEATSLLPICDLGMYGSESCQGCKHGNWALDKFMEKVSKWHAWRGVNCVLRESTSASTTLFSQTDRQTQASPLSSR